MLPLSPTFWLWELEQVSLACSTCGSRNWEEGGRSSPLCSRYVLLSLPASVVSSPAPTPVRPAKPFPTLLCFWPHLGQADGCTLCLLFPPFQDPQLCSLSCCRLTAAQPPSRSNPESDASILSEAVRGWCSGDTFEALMLP